MKYMIMMLLLTSCATLKEKPKFELISVQRAARPEERTFDYLIEELKEFKIGKKHCLWGSKDFDDKCQDAAMEYAYGDNWREFKKVILDFIKYIKEKNAKKIVNLIAWTGKNTYFSISIPKKNKDGLYIPGVGFHLPGGLFSLLDIEHSDRPYYYYKGKALEGLKYVIRIGDEEPLFLEEPTKTLEKYLNNIMPDLSKALDKTEYKDFLITDNDSGGYIIEISKYMTIYFVQQDSPPYTRDRVYNIPKIRSFDYY